MQCGITAKRHLGSDFHIERAAVKEWFSARRRESVKRARGEGAAAGAGPSKRPRVADPPLPPPPDCAQLDAEVVEATQPGLRALLECALSSHLRLDTLITSVAQLGTRVDQLVQAQGAMDTPVADLHRALPLPKMYHVRVRARQPSLPS